MKIIEANWYDYPQYWDISFQSETKREADFIESACSKYCRNPARVMLEPGCGSGRLIVELANRGYEMHGFDINETALSYLQHKLTKSKRSANLFQADMASFELPDPVDAAFNTLNTFRHLTSEREARGHLVSVANSLRTGGIYILGLHLLPLDVADESSERWTEHLGDTRVTTTVRVLNMNRRTRIERVRFIMRVTSPEQVLRIRTEDELRLYTPRQFFRLIKSVAEFEICDLFDFWYEIDYPMSMQDDLIDTVVVLRKR